LLPIPGDEANLAAADEFSRSAARPLPAYMGQTFPKFCRFWSIVHELICLHYSTAGEIVLPYDVATVGFAESTYRALLAWADGLPLDLARGSQNSHHVVTMQ
jgi:hypothetical protein